jgi:HAD superfamily hydrolase (TIGR01549 family)
MFYKSIIFDLDNTLYNYHHCHKTSISKAFNWLAIKYKINSNDFEEIFNNISSSLKNELLNTASSHNKSIYFKQLLENFNVDLSGLVEINEVYWSTFFDTMICFDGLKEFITWNKSLGIKIGILTDYETEFQIQKLDKLNLLNIVDCIVTSEEVGIEKPSIQMFQTILRKMNIRSDDAIMIGDNFDKDIKGAINMGMFGYWFHKNNDVNEKYIEFSSFRELHEEFAMIEEELIKFKELSKYVGERFDLVQAGGGNSSIKIGNWMFIKSSGVNMTQISTTDGYVIIDNKKIQNDIALSCTKDVTSYNIIGKKRGSIETFMHSILKKYTVHLHPIQVNRILVSKNAETISKLLFPDALIIEYLTPGIKVCEEIKKKYNNQDLIFLINHGIIITSDSCEKVYHTLECIIKKFESYQNINYEKFKYTNVLSNYINNEFDLDNVSYLCQNDMIINYLKYNIDLFKEKITFPDALIYCGIKPLFMQKTKDIDTFYHEYNELPKIIIVNGSLYINSNSLNKCKEIEDVLLSNLMILDSSYEKKYLPTEEICFLNNWDAERYRKLF